MMKKVIDRIKKSTKKIIDSISKSSLQRNHQRIAIIGTFITILFGLLTLHLSIKFGKNEEQIKILRNSFELSHMPYLEADVSFGKKYNSVLLINFVNNGGPLKNLTIEANDVVDELNFDSFRKNFARGGSYSKEIRLGEMDDISGSYFFRYENSFDSIFIQELKIIKHNNHNIYFDFSYPQMVIN